MIKTILFDLDGTLLRMDQNAFVKMYFQGLAAHMAHHGYDPNAMIKVIWEGTTAMVANDGKETNEAVFWNVLKTSLGDHIINDQAKFEEFYKEDFENVSVTCASISQAKPLIERLHRQGIRIVLSTNPIFPAVATNARIRWAGLKKEDFELVTTYENSRHCKPNPAYYRDILNELHLNPEECCMVGNDMEEDMIAKTLGMRVFLLTDQLINRSGTDIEQYPHGDFAALENFLEELVNQ